MKQAVAVIFGTFAPMHKGHIDLIQRAKRECGRAIVIVSGYENDRGAQIDLGLDKRFRYICEAFSDEPLVSVQKLDETGLPPYPEGWELWLKVLVSLADIAENEELYFYVSEKDYAEELEHRGFRAHFTERNFGISATLIRENPIQYWNFIAKPFRRHFSKNILILGSISSEKTALARDLGRYYASPVSLEYSRFYQKHCNIHKDELTSRDYCHILTGQYRQTSDLIDSGANYGLVIADSNSTLTQAYHDYYFGQASSSFQTLCEEMVQSEKWSLIFFILPNGEREDKEDQVGYQGFAELLKELVSKNHPTTPIHFLMGSDAENYRQAIELIDGIYKKH